MADCYDHPCLALGLFPSEAIHQRILLYNKLFIAQAITNSAGTNVKDSNIRSLSIVTRQSNGPVYKSAHR